MAEIKPQNRALARQLRDDELINSYGMATAYHMNWTDMETNRTVRPWFGRDDYDAFRPNERVPKRQKDIIKMCMSAYDKVGIVRNIIDLMGDFSCQGINLIHESKSIENFYQQWFRKVNGKERSERFLNNLYRCGNVVCYRSMADLTPKVKQYIRGIAAEDMFDIPEVIEGEIPCSYSFFNPTTIELREGQYYLLINRSKLTENVSFNTNTHGLSTQYIDTLPIGVRNALNDGENKILLDQDRLSLSHYKKDDWQPWANPLVYAILDDIVMLEKMKLADVAALDGAISNIRLWTVGSLEHEILPTRAAINKVRDALAANTGGGTRELVWGPELDFKESNTQVHRFLGSEKYTAVLNSIYAGLGVPPTLTGLANNGGGFTNNFISLKTLVERLQYGRDQLISFWEGEIEMVRKAMGFRKPARVQFDQMSLSDESSEKQLLINLWDRDLVSDDTIRERFKEVPDIERIRIKRQEKLRDKGEVPEKASPFHNPEKQFEMDKIDKNAEKEMEKQEKINEQKQKEVKMNGRPPGAKDNDPRKPRRDTPKSKPGVASYITWAHDNYEKVAPLVNSVYLQYVGKSTGRDLSKAEVEELEQYRLDIMFTLFNTHGLSSFDENDLAVAMGDTSGIPKSFLKELSECGISLENMGLNKFRQSVVAKLSEYLYMENV